MASSKSSSVVLAADRIASYSTTPSTPAHDIEICQAAHRIDLATLWAIPAGSTVLEIGCGQGTCTAVLAEAVGPHGSVDAIDPGSPDYGSPLTLAQAQKIVSASPVGQRISWHYATTSDFLLRYPDKRWDCAVMCHCIWYLDSPEELIRILSSLRERVKRLLVAEYALAATDNAALPHLLTAVARATIEAHNQDSSANIRCLMGPIAITEAATHAGWKLRIEKTIVPDRGLQDGRWEVGSLTANLTTGMKHSMTNPRVTSLVSSLYEVVLKSTKDVGLEQVSTMDVWVASFD